MQILYILRHAEAEPHLDDFHRPLTEKGKQQAMHMHDFFRNISLDYVVCSPAIRTLTTAKLVTDALIHPEPKLYNASYETLITILRNLDPRFSTVLLVGHNPAVSQLAGKVLQPCELSILHHPHWPSGSTLP